MNNKTYFLAIHPGHNASALIGDENGVLYCIQEERLTRNKNEWGFPDHAIQACLQYAGIGPEDVNKVLFGSRQLVLRRHTREEAIQSYARQDSLVGKIRQRVLVPLVLQFKKDFGQAEAKQHLQRLGFDPVRVEFFNHHASHAATAYYGLRKNTTEDYLVITCDGSGEDLCASARIMGPNKDQLVATSHRSNSLGALYSWTTFRMGFVPLEHEYKLMGMAPYAGRSYAEEVRDIYKSFLWLDSSGKAFQRKTLTRTNDISLQLFRKLRGKRFDAICGGLQLFTEELLAAWVQNIVKATGVKKVLAAGGVFMNVKANKTISDLPEVDYFEAFPSCGDESLPFGAYYQALATLKGQEAVQPLKDIYTGTAIDDAKALQLIEDKGWTYEQPADMADRIAELIAQGYPVARSAGRSEFGARALGNRSILANPADKDVVRIINHMIKNRDFWMPFAPMIKKDKSEQYIQNPKHVESPYMMMTFDTKDNYLELIAAVHNGDLTCRAQLLTVEQNPEMYAILDAFEKRTGRAVVLNTSFNLHGYPLVDNEADALYVFENSGLQYLQLGNYLVKKSS